MCYYLVCLLFSMFMLLFLFGFAVNKLALFFVFASSTAPLHNTNKRTNLYSHRSPNTRSSPSSSSMRWMDGLELCCVLFIFSYVSSPAFSGCCCYCCILCWCCIEIEEYDDDCSSSFCCRRADFCWELGYFLFILFCPIIIYDRKF